MPIKPSVDPELFFMWAVVALCGVAILGMAAANVLQAAFGN